MKVEIRDRDAMASLKTLHLRSYLQSRGWDSGGFWGERATIHIKEHGGRNWEILVPLRDTVADYAEAMAEAVAVLAAVEERSQLDVFPRLAGRRRRCNTPGFAQRYRQRIVVAAAERRFV